MDSPAQFLTGIEVKHVAHSYYRGEQSRWRQLSCVGSSTVPHEMSGDHLQQLEGETKPGVPMRN